MKNAATRTAEDGAEAKRSPRESSKSNARPAEGVPPSPASANSNQTVVFFAWQTDSPERTNRRAIRSALRTAFSKLEQEFSETGLELVLEEATKGIPGSPNIPQTILWKIEQSSIFICDLTTIAAKAASHVAVPNPNVIYELGYAVAHLGWPCIIMLFNKALGTFPDDLPFDVDRHRASPYLINDDSEANKASIRAPLESLLIDALKLIIVENPKKPGETKVPSTAELHRTRDIETLRSVLATIHWPTLDQHMIEAPHIIEGRVFHFWEGFNSVVNSSLFHLYDQSLASKVKRFCQLWGKTLSFGHFYNQSHHSDRSVFATEMDMFTSREQERAWKLLSKTVKQLRKAADDLLEDIRKRYLELDLPELDRAAWTEYVNFRREVATRLDVGNSGTAPSGKQGSSKVRGGKT